jgi:hypothetical protein
LLDWADVLVLNFDSINGDPVFGSDVALDWFRHRELTILAFVAEGGIVVVEGQTMLSVPVQESYDAIFGRRELRVSGPTTRSVSSVERDKIGGSCRINDEAGRRYNLFTGLGTNRIFSDAPDNVQHFFPGAARLALGVANEEDFTWKLLYRGWFSRLRPLSRRLRWVNLIETDNQPYPQAVLVGAQWGNGAIFASTMFLAGTGEGTLFVVKSLFKWNSKDNPLPKSKSDPSVPLEPRWWQRKKFFSVLADSFLSALGAVVATEVLKKTGFLRAGSQTLTVGILMGSLWLVMWGLRKILVWAAKILGE